MHTPYAPRRTYGEMPVSPYNPYVSKPRFFVETSGLEDLLK